MVNVTKVENGEGFYIQRVIDDSIENISRNNFKMEDILGLIKDTIIKIALDNIDEVIYDDAELADLAVEVAEECNIWEDVFYDIDSSLNESGDLEFIYALTFDGDVTEDSEVFSSEGLEKFKHTICLSLARLMINSRGIF